VYSACFIVVLLSRAILMHSERVNTFFPCPKAKAEIKRKNKINFFISFKIFCFKNLTKTPTPLHFVLKGEVKLTLI